jgi:predicted esterase
MCLTRFTYACLSLVVLLCATTTHSQPGRLVIPFFEQPPVIDGKPDDMLTSVPWREFSYIEKTSEANMLTPVRYKLVYGHSYLYVLIESACDSIVWRDRAYQNGDGFHLVIAKPDTGTSTREFYVLRFSPPDAKRTIPAYKALWYYNVGFTNKALGARTKFVCASGRGKSYFEVLLPWSEIHPYHPSFSDSIGFNLCFVKAVGAKEKNYYFLKNDRYIQSELRPREYLTAAFEKFDVLHDDVTLAQLDRNTVRTGETVHLNAVSYNRTGRELSVNWSVQSADNYPFTGGYHELPVKEGRTAQTFELPVGSLLPGGYKITWRCSDNSEGEMPLTVLPSIIYETEKARLDSVGRKNISEGTIQTMLFRLKDIVEMQSRLKPYETAGDIREAYSSYCDILRSLESGYDVFARKTGIFRRAFRSKLDGTLQPYSVKIPPAFDRTKKYPLLVFLHGSGSDDRGMLSGTPFSENDWIELAPFGRGTSNCFTADHAEIDVKEAIDDAIRNYPIDTTRIVIEGFSMGGYGAYRLFYEYPTLFTGIAVFSGHPNLATHWLGEGYPDFLDAKYLKVFNRVPVFIYHSKNDLNCPFDLTLTLVEMLRSAGARVTFVTTTDGGHGVINNANIPTYYRWLSTVGN